MNFFSIFVLGISGLALFYASSMRLINPAKGVFLQTYFEHPANSLDNHIDLANEIRGVGAFMLLAGILALLGAVKEEVRLTALVVTTIVFCGVILGRSFSFLIDGIPHQNLIRAAIIEGVLAAINLVCLVNILLQGRH